MPDRPHIRARSRTVQVTGEMAWGAACVFEIRAEDYLFKSTNRYRKVWTARRFGTYAWHMGRTPAIALRHAASLGPRSRPAWLAAAVANAPKGAR